MKKTTPYSLKRCAGWIDKGDQSSLKEDSRLDGSRNPKAPESNKIAILRTITEIKLLVNV